MKLKTVTASRYITPLREGGSLPAIVEADDEGTYVLKFHGAGQGKKVLIAELLVGEIARAAQLPMPELVFMELDPDLARTEPDAEIQQLIRASAGLNIALDYLPGAVTFDPVAEKANPALASAIVWLDAYVSNVDRTARNANMLTWHRQLRLIDHGAALYFHHAWDPQFLERSTDSFPLIKDHILLPFADSLREADVRMRQHIKPALIQSLVELIPDAWLTGDNPFPSGDAHRQAYVDYLVRRLESPPAFLEEAVRARSLLV